MKDIIESLNAKILQEKISNLSQYKFEVPIEDIFELPKNEANSALSLSKQNSEKSKILFGKQKDQEKPAAARAIFGAKPNLAALAAKKDFFKNPFARKPEIKNSSSENFLQKNKNEETNKSNSSSEKAKEYDFPQAQNLMEDLELNEAASEKAQFQTNSVARKLFISDAFASQNFTQQANLLNANENKNNNLLNSKFNELINFNHNSNENHEKYKNNSIRNLNIFHSNEKNNLFSFDDHNENNKNNNEEKNVDLANTRQKPKISLLSLNPAVKPNANPFKEKIKLLFNKRNSEAEKCGDSALNPFERLERLKAKNLAFSPDSKHSTEDDASSIDNCVSSVDPNEDKNSFNSLFADPFKYNRLLLESTKMD